MCVCVFWPLHQFGVPALAVALKKYPITALILSMSTCIQMHIIMATNPQCKWYLPVVWLPLVWKRSTIAIVQVERNPSTWNSGNSIIQHLQ